MIFINQVRNDLTWMLCNFLINHLAVGDYQRFLKTIIGMGVETFDTEFWKRYHTEQEEKEGA